MNNKHFNYLLFFLLPAIWGASFTAIKIAVSAQPPVFAAMVRVAISLICLGVIFRLGKKSTAIPLKDRWEVWIVGLFALGLPFALLFWGELFISPSLAGILNGTAPIWTFILGLFFLQLHQLPGLTRKLIGLLIGIGGILIVFLPNLRLENGNLNLLGAFAVLGMALCYAISALLNQRLLQKKAINFFANLYHQHWSALFFLLIVSACFEHWPKVNSLISNPHLLLADAYLGIASTAFGWMMYYYLIRNWGAIRATVTVYLIPVAAILWDWIFFNNRPMINEIIGVGVIVLGVILVQLNRSKHSNQQIEKPSTMVTVK